MIKIIYNHNNQHKILFTSKIDVSFFFIKIINLFFYKFKIITISITQ